MLELIQERRNQEVFFPVTDSLTGTAPIVWSREVQPVRDGIETSFARYIQPIFYGSSGITFKAYQPLTGNPFLGWIDQSSQATAEPLQGELNLFGSSETTRYQAVVSIASSTLDIDVDNTRAFLRKALLFADEESFEDGVESTLSKEIEKYVQDSGIFAIKELEFLLFYLVKSSRVIAETLNTLGEISDSKTEHERVRVLINFIGSEIPNIRDAAALGLASIGGLEAFDAISRAFDAETNEVVKNNLNVILRYLEKTNTNDLFHSESKQ